METYLGSAGPMSGNLGYARRSGPLAALFVYSGSNAEAGSTYRITVGYADDANNVNQLLGSTTFTYQRRCCVIANGWRGMIGLRGSRGVVGTASMQRSLSGGGP